MKARATASGLALTLVLAGCAAVGRQPPGVGPQARMKRATEALEREAFATARFELQALVADCSSGRLGREALLVLAAAELDTGNPDRSPRRAAHLAGAYLLLPDAEPAGIAVARAIYRLGTELTIPVASGGGMLTMPPVASRFDSCGVNAALAGARALPDVPSSREDRLAHLRSELAAQGDAVSRLRSNLVSERARNAALQAEIERITELLKSGTPAYPRQRR